MKLASPGGARRDCALAEMLIWDVLMRTEIDHLPQVAILMEEFGTATARATQPWKRNGKIYKIILFGSYARDDWVDEPDNGYQSDFDLLIVVSHRDLTEIADYWYVAEDRILRDPSISRPMPLTPADAHRMAKEYFEHWLPSADQFVAHGMDAAERGWLSKAAFELHQATERLYICFLLVRTLYFPCWHNIKFLRSLAEDNEPRLIDAWPCSTKLDRRRFELLKRAYVEAPYSANYEIGREDLDALTESIRHLRDLVEQVSRERLETLTKAS